MKILLILLFTLSAQAGVQVVGNGKGKGGGYGEMQAILINMKIASFVQSCTRDPASCNLTRAQGQILDNATALPFDLTLDPTCANDEPVVVSDSQAVLSSCALYNPPTPFQSASVKEFREIASVVLQTRLVASQNVSETEARVIAENVFAGFIQNEDALAINLNAGNFVAHTLDIESLHQKQTVFSLEGQVKTVDLTSDILKTLNCSSENLKTFEIHLLNASSIADNEGMIESDIAWTCDKGPLQKALLQVYFEADQGEVKTPVLAIRLVGRH